MKPPNEGYRTVPGSHYGCCLFLGQGVNKVCIYIYTYANPCMYIFLMRSSPIRASLWPVCSGNSNTNVGDGCNRVCVV